MNTQELNRFIQAIHYLDLLSAATKAWKPRTNYLNRIRSRIEQLAVLRATDRPSMSENFAETTLKQFTSLAIPVIATLTPAQLVVVLTADLTPNFKVNGKHFSQASVKKLMEPLAKLAESNPPWSQGNREPLAGVTGANRGQMLRAFCSLCRNTNWTMSLLSLGTSVEDAMAFTKALQTVKGSRTGSSDEHVAKCLAILVGPATKAVEEPATQPGPAVATKVPEPRVLGEVVVKFSLESLMTDPDIAASIRRLQRDAPQGDESLKRFLQTLRTGLPVVKGTVTLDEALATAMAEVLKKLQQLESDIQALRETVRLAKEKEQKEKLLKELRKLGPTLELLKKNPELLKEL